MDSREPRGLSAWERCQRPDRARAACSDALVFASVNLLGKLWAEALSQQIWVAINAHDRFFRACSLINEREGAQLPLMWHLGTAKPS